MDNKIDLIMSSIQQSCRAGYLLPKERQTLSDLAELHGIDKAELETVLTRELEKVRKGRLVDLYKVTKQPDAALSDNVAFFQQSRRQFPDILKLGTLKLKQNHNVTAPAFVPLKGMSGLCLIHNDQAEMACNIIQNVALRLMLSIPRSLAHITVVDPSSMGADYIGLSEIDNKLLKVIDDDKQVLPFLQNLSREAASFNFNELGSTFADIAEYNRTNRSKAHAYQLVILSDFQNVNDKNILAEIKKINKLATKTGIFFLFAFNPQQSSITPELLDIFKTRQEESPNLCVIDTIKKEVHAEVNDEEAFFNNAFDFEIDENLMFTADTILQLNHEFDPNKYPIESPIDIGDDCIEALNIVVGKQVNKDKVYTVALQQARDNILCVLPPVKPESYVTKRDNFAKEKYRIIRIDGDNALCEHIVSYEQETIAVDDLDDKKMVSMAVGMLQGMVANYKRSEINYIFYNCGFIPESLCADNVLANIHADKMGYLQSLLKYVEQMTDARKKQFQDANASSYESYRNLVESPMPRLVLMIGDIDKILDSESMGAVESVMLLDQLLNEAGQYGIHFILMGKPTANLFKLNLAEYVRFKLFGSLDEEEIMQIGISATEDNLLHQNQPNGSLIYDGSNDVSVKIELADKNDEALKDALNAFVAEELPISQPKVFVDLNDTYPQSYRSINSETIAEACITNDIPIGFLRGFATEFATLGHKNVIIVGDAPEGEESILQSIYFSLKRSGKLSELSICDVTGCHPMGIPGMAGVKISNIDSLTVNEGSVICILNSDSLTSESVQSLDNIVDDAHVNHAQIVLFAKNDFDVNNMGLSGHSFNTRIALCNAPDGFLSPLHFLSNDELRMPSAPLQALCEQTDAEGGMNIKAMWLFNY